MSAQKSVEPTSTGGCLLRAAAAPLSVSAFTTPPGPHSCLYGAWPVTVTSCMTLTLPIV
jgi:hypothetical protein